MTQFSAWIIFPCDYCNTLSIAASMKPMMNHLMDRRFYMVRGKEREMKLAQPADFQGYVTLPKPTPSSGSL
jgi:hypothetical protein